MPGAASIGERVSSGAEAPRVQMRHPITHLQKAIRSLLQLRATERKGARHSQRCTPATPRRTTQPKRPRFQNRPPRVEAPHDHPQNGLS